MNKLMTVGLATLFAAGFVNAQDGVVMVGQAPAGNGSEAEASAEVALVSADVWRGQVRNEDFVLQPQFTVANYGFSFNVWANYDISSNYAGVDNDFSEIDLSLAYTVPVDLNDFAFDVGVISYQFPANGDKAGTGSIEGYGLNRKSTAELFASAYWLTFKNFVIPSATVFQDVNEAKGTYLQFDIVAPYEVSEYFWVEVGASTGWGSSRYNNFYYGNPSAGVVNDFDKGFSDYNFYGTASYELLDDLTISLNLTYTGLYGGAIKEAAKQNYEAGEQFWGGVNLAYDF